MTDKKDDAKSYNRRLFTSDRPGDSKWTKEGLELSRQFGEHVKQFLKDNEGVDIRDLHFVMTSTIETDVIDEILRERLGRPQII